MNEVTDVVVQYVNQPKPGKKWGSIKTATGEYYSGPPALVNEFKQGEECKVEWKPFGESGKEIVKKIGGVINGGLPKQNVRQRMDPADARGAFVSLLCQAWAQAGMLPIDADAVANARRKAGAGFDMEYNPQRADDLDDQIPY